MFCPVCKRILKKTGYAWLETMTEHVTNPNVTPGMKAKYECPNPDCAGYGNLYWNEYGEMYVDDYDRYDRSIFTDGSAPYDSMTRRLDEERKIHGHKDKESVKN